jgi:hypothetical protein
MTNPKDSAEGDESERPKSPRRRPPTIDLEATEITVEPAAAAAPPPGAVPEENPRAAGATDPPSEGAPAAAAPPASQSAGTAGATASGRWRFAGGVAAGAGTTALVVAALWLLDAVPLRPATDHEPMLAAKVAALDRRIQELATRPAVSPPSSQTDLEARLAALEATRSSPAPAPDSTLARIGALEQRLNEVLGREAGAASPPADDSRAAADHQEIAALTARVAALEQRLNEVRSTTSSDQAVRLGLAAMALRMAVERGSPFSAELAAVSRLVDDPSGLAPLKAMAESGLPAPAALAQTLSKLTPAMLQAVGPQGQEGGVLDRLEAGAERLVRIRRIDEPPGDDPAALIARADVKATHGDIAGALAEIDKLPDRIRAPASGWISAARARLAALDAARQLSTHALQALAPLAP